MIGVFDSGFGGLTVLRSLLDRLPSYDYLYLGDSARAPYGMRSAEAVYEFTREAMHFLFDAGCPLVIVACNTASARALRRLQQWELPRAFPDRRVLGVVRPSVEALAGLPPGSRPESTLPSSVRGTVAVLGTPGTIASNSYADELSGLAPGLELVQQACPMWVPLVESGELVGAGAEFFLRKYLTPVLARARPPGRILLGCTHYPLLLPGIRAIVPPHIAILPQGELVAERLEDWLRRHPEHRTRLTETGGRRYVTTDDPAWFAAQGSAILGTPIRADKVRLLPIASAEEASTSSSPRLAPFPSSGGDGP